MEFSDRRPDDSPGRPEQDPWEDYEIPEYEITDEPGRPDDPEDSEPLPEAVELEALPSTEIEDVRALPQAERMALLTAIQEYAHGGEDYADLDESEPGGFATGFRREIPPEVLKQVGLRYETVVATIEPFDEPGAEPRVSLLLSREVTTTIILPLDEAAEALEEVPIEGQELKYAELSPVDLADGGKAVDVYTSSIIAVPRFDTATFSPSGELIVEPETRQNDSPLLLDEVRRVISALALLRGTDPTGSAG